MYLFREFHMYLLRQFHMYLLREFHMYLLRELKKYFLGYRTLHVWIISRETNTSLYQQETNLKK